MPAGLCVALAGMALKLINFGIDEYVNLRLAGLSPRQMRKKGLRPRIGFTAIVRDAPRGTRPEDARHGRTNLPGVSNEHELSDP